MVEDSVIREMVAAVELANNDGTHDDLARYLQRRRLR
jgi:hypothetical protein